jgi:hypothetical protein
MERVVAPGLSQTIASSSEPEGASNKAVDKYPLVPVFIAGVIALTLSAAFVGSILAWIALRNSGVMAL